MEISKTYLTKQANYGKTINLTSLRNLSGCRFESVRKYLDEKRVMIDDHNAKYGLSDYHNQQHGKKKKIKIEDVIQW